VKRTKLAKAEQIFVHRYHTLWKRGANWFFHGKSSGPWLRLSLAAKKHFLGWKSTPEKEGR
jgi:hypothetical protein